MSKYDAYVQELEIAAQPADGSECPLLGDLLERHEIRDMNQQHAEEFDKSIEVLSLLNSFSLLMNYRKH